MKVRVLSWVLAAGALLMSPMMALAKATDEEIPDVDARLEGYSTNVAMKGGTALTWLLFLFLCVLCVGVLFKNAKRTHLD